MTTAAADAGVESLVARCLLEPEFLRAVAAGEEAGLSAQQRRDLAELDLERVGQFAGFITKVQNNHLWEPLPFTRALMKHYGIEIETFAAFRARHLVLRAARASRDEKVAAFIEFLDERLAAADGLPGLRDILRHERLRMELATAGRAAARHVDAPRPPGFGALVPAARGVLRVASFAYDPLAIAATISRGALGAEELAAGPVCLAYVAGAEGLRVLEVDELTAALLAHADGRRRVGEIVAIVAGEPVSEQLVARARPIFDAAEDAGVIVLRGAG